MINNIINALGTPAHTLIFIGSIVIVGVVAALWATYSVKGNMMKLNRDAWTSEKVKKYLIKKGQAAVEPLLRALRKNTGEYKRVDGEYIEILGEIGDTRAVDLLLELMMSEDNGHRIEIIIALGKLNDKRATEALIKILESGHYSEYVIRALGMIKDSRAIPALRPHALYADNKGLLARKALENMGDGVFVKERVSFESLVRGLIQEKFPTEKKQYFADISANEVIEAVKIYEKYGDFIVQKVEPSYIYEEIFVEGPPPYDTPFMGPIVRYPTGEFNRVYVGVDVNIIPPQHDKAQDVSNGGIEIKNIGVDKKEFSS